MTLQPGNSFTIVRQIANHLDTDTNYVRAVIRNAYTDAIVDTLSLTDKGGQRFKKDWQTPKDSSGQGFYISIVTSVYTDNAYTTKNPNYGDEENTYLVQERVQPLMRGGGGLDAFTVRQILKDELAKLPAPAEMPEQKEYAMRWDEVLAAITDLQKAVAQIPTSDTDFAPLTKQIAAVLTAIQQKPVTPGTDLSPVTAAVQQLSQNLAAQLNKLQILLMTTEQTFSQSFIEATKAELLKTIESTLKGTTFSIAPSTATMNPAKKPAADATQPVPFDVSQLAQ